MTEEPRDARKNETEPQPYRVRLPGFITEEQVGLGDLVKKATLRFGVKPCGSCNTRAATLNRWLTFGRRPR
jgi:hypothetical protein